MQTNRSASTIETATALALNVHGHETSRVIAGAAAALEGRAEAFPEGTDSAIAAYRAGVAAARRLIQTGEYF